MNRFCELTQGLCPSRIDVNSLFECPHARYSAVSGEPAECPIPRETDAVKKAVDNHLGKINREGGLN